MSKNWNADDWHLYLSQLVDTRANFPNGLNSVALKIAETVDGLNGDVTRIKIQRDNALLDMERFMNERDAALAALSTRS